MKPPFFFLLMFASFAAFGEQGCPNLNIAKTWNTVDAAGVIQTGVVDFKNQNCSYAANDGSKYAASGDWREVTALSGTGDVQSGSVAINIRNNTGTSGPQKGSYGPCDVSIARTDKNEDVTYTETAQKTETVEEPDPNDSTKTVTTQVIVEYTVDKTKSVKVADAYDMTIACGDGSLLERLHREEAMSP